MPEPTLSQIGDKAFKRIISLPMYEARNVCDECGGVFKMKAGVLKLWFIAVKMFIDADAWKGYGFIVEFDNDYTTFKKKHHYFIENITVEEAETPPPFAFSL